MGNEVPFGTFGSVVSGRAMAANVVSKDVFVVENKGLSCASAGFVTGAASGLFSRLLGFRFKLTEFSLGSAPTWMFAAGES